MITLDNIRLRIRDVIRFSNLETMERIPVHKITTYYKIMFVKDGNTRLHWIDPSSGDEREHRLTKGEFFYVPPQTMYYNENGSFPFDVTVLLFTIEWNNMTEEEILVPTYPIHYHGTKIPDNDFPPKVHIEDAPCLDNPFVISDSFGGKALVARLEDENTSRCRYYGAMKNILLYELLTLLARTKEEEGQQGKCAHHTAEQLLIYINQHAEDGITCQSTAKALGYHPNYLNTVISGATGMTFHAYLHDTKLRQAEMLVRGTSRPISEIAAIYGFFDVSAFTRAYKKKFGITPYQHRIKTCNIRKKL